MKTLPNKTASESAPRKRHHNPSSAVPGTSRPIVTGQCAQVYKIIRDQGPVLSFVMTADCAIPEAAARVHDLRAKGFNIVTQIHSAIEFRGSIRRNAATYSMGVPEWPAPGFLATPAPERQRGLF
ncbi:MAG: helix-turn-helix domain-containing protein [Candidatus Accumulibacter sp.]|uniref:helix-turn-helix domain-containing protein n=1 Tax=Accumulibacter sp. TaxID=2053492 RepID=UPI001B0AAB1C|nr:helix-turn-helix domain-containing protein [Accumulibacter sp.]MBO3704280.1 helix-turn-helix domain-containing protein [Accumulibacter sp.]